MQKRLQQNLITPTASVGTVGVGTHQMSQVSLGMNSLSMPTIGEDSPAIVGEGSGNF